MPTLKKKDPLVKVVLPTSTPEDEAYVMLDIDFRGGDMLDVFKDKDSAMSEYELGLRSIFNAVKEWNFVDYETKQPLPITLENIRLLDPKDTVAIIERIESVKSLSDAKKKS